MTRTAQGTNSPTGLPTLDPSHDVLAGGWWCSSTTIRQSPWTDRGRTYWPLGWLASSCLLVWQIIRAMLLIFIAIIELILLGD